MKIYFAGSIRGGREDAARYNEIINFLKNFGEVLTEHVGDVQLSSAGDDGPTDKFIHDRDMEWLNASDLVLAEITTVSMGVGYEIGCAVSMRKPVLCLFRPDAGKNISAMISGCDKLTLVHYSTSAQAKMAIQEYLENAF